MEPGMNAGPRKTKPRERGCQNKTGAEAEMLCPA
jgi:hypothetical protein